MIDDPCNKTGEFMPCDGWVKNVAKLGSVQLNPCIRIPKTNNICEAHISASALI